MTTRMGWVSGLAFQLAFCCGALAQGDVVTEGGVQYRVTQRIERRPVTDRRYEERRSTVYREEVATETRDIERVVQLPVTEYVWEPYWVNRWNLFRTPYIAYRLVPRTRLELRAETVRMPIASSRLVPVERTERVPIISHRMADVEVIERVPLSPSSSAVPPPPGGTPTADGRHETGGRQLVADPPRQTTSLEWRPAGGTRYRY